MGIPSYFVQIVKKHRNIISTLNYFKQKQLKRSNNQNIDNLFLDSNSIIYDSVRLVNSSDVSIISQKVIEKIEEYISLIKPTNTIMIAFDGVAPVAKLEQQRIRRYKSWYQNEIYNSIFFPELSSDASSELSKEKKKPVDAFNTACITPGTVFFKKLNNIILKHFKQAENKYNVKNIIISTSDEVCEGEHKIFDYIRKNSEANMQQVNVVYGLDADLIMLSIIHLSHNPNIYLFRETPEFIKYIDNTLEPNETYLLNIPELAKNLPLNSKNISNFSVFVDKNSEPWDIYNEFENIPIFDYIFLCFFLGNDFLPHFPSVNIRSGGIDKLVEAYNAVIDDKTYLINGSEKTINWNNVFKIVEYLANKEEQHLKKETLLRDKREKFHYSEETPEQKYAKFEAIPNYERDLEKYINPFKTNWQNRYYKALFSNLSTTEMNPRTPPAATQKGQGLGMSEGYNSTIKNICINYLEGLEWTFKYYISECPDWRWCYKYSYPPLFQDLYKFMIEENMVEKNMVEGTERNKNVEFVTHKNKNPVTSLVQLCYVLPRKSLNLLPKNIQKVLKTKKWHPNNCEFTWAYCKYFWECHPDLPEIDINELEGLLEKLNEFEN